MGIISYELAGTVGAGAKHPGFLGRLTQLHAAFALGFDYVFMLAYSTAIGLACVMAAGVLGSRGWPLAGIGAGLAWAQWLAAGLDAVENFALTAMLFGGVARPGRSWPTGARCSNLAWSSWAWCMLFMAGWCGCSSAGCSPSRF